MTYSGMPFGMWTLFAPSFRKQLTAVFGYDTDTAKAIAKKAIEMIYLMREGHQIKETVHFKYKIIERESTGK